MLAELERASHQIACSIFIVQNFGRRRLAIQWGGLGLGIEQIDRAGPAVHEQLNDSPRLRFEVWWPALNAMLRCLCSYNRRRLSAKSRQCQPAKPATELH